MKWVLMFWHVYLKYIAVCQTQNRRRWRRLKTELKHRDYVANRDKFDCSELQQQRQDDITDSKNGLLLWQPYRNNTDVKDKHTLALQWEFPRVPPLSLSFSSSCFLSSSMSFLSLAFSTSSFFSSLTLAWTTAPGKKLCYLSELKP